MEPVNDVIVAADNAIWYVGLAIILIAGLFFLYKFKGMQVVRLPEHIKLLRPKKQKKRKGETSVISSFQAFCVGMGARIGVGNIAGVATAIFMGGAGAIMWMWIFALIGACTSFVESTLGQLFKEKKSDGQYHGGPAYYIKNGMKNHKFAVFIAFWIILTYGIGFVANQAANSADAFTALAPEADWLPIVLAIVFAAMTAFLVFGGIVRIAKFSEILVPVMAVAWMVFALAAIVLNFGYIDDAIALIVTDAFDFQKIIAGFTGSCIMYGLRRGVFSNEAGIGSVANIASSAHVEHPVRQGYLQSIGVLIDTLVVCSATAFLLLTYFPDGLVEGGLHVPIGEAIKGGMYDTTPLEPVREALAATLGGSWTSYLLAIFMFVFAFSSLISYYSMSEANLRFIKDSPKNLLVLRILVVAAVFVACIVPVTLVWNLMDLFMAVMAIMNIYALFHLYKYVVAVHDDYRKQKDAGTEVPEFYVDNIKDSGLDTSGITVWDRE